MAKKKMIGLLLVVLVLSACKKQKNAASAPGDPLRAAVGLIEKAVIEPAAPLISSVVRVLVTFREKPAAPLPLAVTWYVNGAVIGDVNSTVLPKGNYVRGDIIHCLVKPAVKGAKKVFRSRAVTVANSPPEFRLKDLPPLPEQGDYVFQVFAEDPDGDDVTYHLISPGDREITVNSATGVFSFNIEPPGKPGENSGPVPGEESETADRERMVIKPEKEIRGRGIKLVFEARDTLGAATRITLHLAPGQSPLQPE